MGESIQEFLMGFKTEATKETYLRNLDKFLQHYQISPNNFLTITRAKPKEAEKMLQLYLHARKGSLTGASLAVILQSLKAFLIMNDVENGVNWSKISRGLPTVRHVGQDRTPTIEEVRRMIDYSDVRLRTIILVLLSSGMRVGGFEFLSWGDVEPHETPLGTLARLRVYRGEPEQYVTFVTPEAYSALVEYRRRREAIGEVIKPDSPIIRNTWNKRGGGGLDPKIARRSSIVTIQGHMLRLLWKAGLRNQRKKLHDFKALHGFRKFFETNALRAVSRE